MQIQEDGICIMMKEAQEETWTTRSQVAEALRTVSGAYSIRIAAFSTDAVGEDIGSRDRLTVHIVEDGAMGYRELDRFMAAVDGLLSMNASYELMGNGTSEEQLESMGAVVAYKKGADPERYRIIPTEEDRMKGWTTRTRVAEVIREVSGPCNAGIVAFTTGAPGEDIGPRDSITIYVVNGGNMSYGDLGIFMSAVNVRLPRKVDYEVIDHGKTAKDLEDLGATVAYIEDTDRKGTATLKDILQYRSYTRYRENDPVMVSWERSEDGTVLTDCSGWETWVEFHEDGSAVVWGEDDPYVSCPLSREGMEAVARYWIEMHGDGDR